MSADNGRDIVIAVTSPDKLFNAPSINPFSEKDVDVLGESGLTLIVRQLQTYQRDWRYERLLVRLPPESITPGLERQLADAVRRYCKAKIATNLVEMHLMRVRSGVWWVFERNCDRYCRRCLYSLYHCIHRRTAGCPTPRSRDHIVVLMGDIVGCPGGADLQSDTHAARELRLAQDHRPEYGDVSPT